MTRKDYVMLAETISEVLDELTGSFAYENVVTIMTIHANKLADRLAKDNKAFDRTRFLKACGVV